MLSYHIIVFLKNHFPSFYRMLKEPLLPLGEDFKGNTDEKNLEENASLLYSPENSQISNIPMEIVKNIF